MTSTPQHQLQRFYNTVRRRAPVDHGRFSWLLGPDLIFLDDQYVNSAPRIAIIGQEVRDWYYTYPQFIAGKWDCWYAASEKPCVQKAVAEYQGFDFAYSEEEPSRRTPFWQFFHEIRETAFPSERGAHRKVLWTNLVKFVTKDGSLLTMPYTEAEEAIQLQDDILTTELRIAKPEFCLFVTGPNFDCMLRRYFPGLRFVPLQTHERKAQLAEREFALLVHPQLPLHSYRTYHPGHLIRQKKLRKKVLQILSHQLAACQ